MLAGFGTAFATAYVCALLSALIGFSPYDFSIMLFIPVGALICGYAAVSGFVVVARREGRQRPYPMLLIAMVFAACLSQFLIFWFDYHGGFLPGASLAPYFGFQDYLQLHFTQAQIVMRGRTFQNESGDLVSALAAVKVVGFLLSAFVTYKQLPGSGSFLDD